MNIPEFILNDVKDAQLFGSRSMMARPAVDSFDPAIMIGTQITEETDWDFSLQYSDAAHANLLAAGFTHYSKEDMGSYCDDLTTAVYIKEYCFGSFVPTRTANVVLHSDEQLFRRVWDAITPEFYYRYLWKRSPLYYSTPECKLLIKDIMNQLYTIAKAAQ